LHDLIFIRLDFNVLFLLTVDLEGLLLVFHHKHEALMVVTRLLRLVVNSQGVVLRVGFGGFDV
jgi:hypothetical protein